MRTPKYICVKCKYPFTRKWNANRHCNIKHFGKIENIISFTDYMMNHKDSSFILNYLYEDNNNNNGHHAINVKNHLLSDNSSFLNKNLPSNTLDPFEEVIDHKLASSLELLDQLATKYEEMQQLLESLAEPYRQTFIQIALLSAITSDHPVETMHKKLLEYRKSKTIIMMLKDIASIYGQDNEYIKEFLKLKFIQNGKRNLTNKIKENNVLYY
jgi:hypothetical protein